MKNFCKKLLVTLMFFSLVTAIIPVSFAQGTVLPKADTTADCAVIMSGLASNGGVIDKSIVKDDKSLSDLLGCGVKTGRISLSMVPYFIKYFSNYLLGMVSLIALLFVVIGGFMYTVGDLIEKKEKGKAYIKNALIGMVVAFLAWSIVSVILAAITG